MVVVVDYASVAAAATGNLDQDDDVASVGNNQTCCWHLVAVGACLDGIHQTTADLERNAFSSLAVQCSHS